MRVSITLVILALLACSPNDNGYNISYEPSPETKSAVADFKTTQAAVYARSQGSTDHADATVNAILQKLLSCEPQQKGNTIFLIGDQCPVEYQRKTQNKKESSEFLLKDNILAQINTLSFQSESTETNEVDSDTKEHYTSMDIKNTFRDKNFGQHNYNTFNSHREVPNNKQFMTYLKVQIKSQRGENIAATMREFGRKEGNKEITERRECHYNRGSVDCDLMLKALDLVKTY